MLPTSPWPYAYPSWPPYGQHAYLEQPPHSAPPYVPYYPASHLHYTSQGSIPTQQPPFRSQPLNQLQYHNPPTAPTPAPTPAPPRTPLIDDEQEAALRRTFANVGSSPTPGIAGDEADEEYVPAGASRSRSSSKRGSKKRGGRKSITKGHHSAPPSRSGSIKPPLRIMPPNIPVLPSAGYPSGEDDPNILPPEISKRLKNFSGVLLAYPPGTSLDINNLLIVTPPERIYEHDGTVFEKYTCRVCAKTYAGKNARSVARRHLQDKHNVPLSVQPRRNRWEKEPNRPRSSEEARARNLEQKRAWAKDNRYVRCEICPEYRQRRRDCRIALRGPFDDVHAEHLEGDAADQMATGSDAEKPPVEPMPNSEMDAEGEVDEDVPMQDANEMEEDMQDVTREDLKLEEELVKQEFEAAPHPLQSPLSLLARHDTPISSPQRPPDNTKWLERISISSNSAQVILPTSIWTPLQLSVPSMPHAMLHPPFVLKPSAEDNSDAYIENESSTSPTANEAEHVNDQARREDQHLISVADSLLNLHSTPIGPSPDKSTRKPSMMRGVSLNYSPIKARSRSTSDSWNLSFGPLDKDKPTTTPLPSLPETPVPTWVPNSGVTRPRPTRTRSLVQPLTTGMRPGALARSLTCAWRLDDPFMEESPGKPLASSPPPRPAGTRQFPPEVSSPTASSSSGSEHKRIAISYDPGSSSSSSSETSPKASASPPPPISQSLSLATPSNPSATSSKSSTRPYDSSSSLLFSSTMSSSASSSSATRPWSLKTPHNRRSSSSMAPPPSTVHSNTRAKREAGRGGGGGGWMMSSPANAETANELGLVPDYLMPQTPGMILDFVRKTPGTFARARRVVASSRSTAEDEAMDNEAE